MREFSLPTRRFICIYFKFAHLTGNVLSIHLSVGSKAIAHVRQGAINTPAHKSGKSMPFGQFAASLRALSLSVWPACIHLPRFVR